MRYPCSVRPVWGSHGFLQAVPTQHILYHNRRSVSILFLPKRKESYSLSTVMTQFALERRFYFESRCCEISRSESLQSSPTATSNIRLECVGPCTMRKSCKVTSRSRLFRKLSHDFARGNAHFVRLRIGKAYGIHMNDEVYPRFFKEICLDIVYSVMRQKHILVRVPPLHGRSRKVRPFRSNERQGHARRERLHTNLSKKLYRRRVRHPGLAEKGVGGFTDKLEPRIIIYTAIAHRTKRQPPIRKRSKEAFRRLPLRLR